MRQVELIPCGCNCGTLIPARDRQYRHRRFAFGHGNGHGIFSPEHFWARVEELPTDEAWCRLWLGAVDRKGYGSVNRSTKRTLVHRLAWELTHGPIPDGLWVLHVCDTPACVRCDGPLTAYWANGTPHPCHGHLWLGTNADNIADMHAKQRNVSAPRRGEANGFAKLTDDIVRAARIAYANGETQTAIAARYGVGQDTISLAVLGKTWRHVE